MTKIVPAILTRSLENYRQQLKTVRKLTNRFQLDFIDTGFADNATIMPADIELPRDLQVDIDLMSSDPASLLPSIFQHKPNLVIFHFFEGVDLSPLIEKTKAKNIDVGVALEPDMSVQILTPLIDKIKLVQLMGHKSGFASLPFEEAVLDRVDQIRDLNQHINLAVDGGVNLDIMPKLVESGIDIIYVNSYIFDSADPLVRYTNLLGAIS